MRYSSLLAQQRDFWMGLGTFLLTWSSQGQPVKAVVWACRSLWQDLVCSQWKVSGIVFPNVCVWIALGHVYIYERSETTDVLGILQSLPQTGTIFLKENSYILKACHLYYAMLSEFLLVISFEWGMGYIKIMTFHQILQWVLDL